jgi:periplasmic protein TonB
MLVQPAYPASAANKGIEGYVDVQFDVAPTGATDNIVIVASMPSNVFDRETVKAVKRWKFNPVIKDGRAIPYKGLVQRVHFEMQKL